MSINKISIWIFCIFFTSVFSACAGSDCSDRNGQKKVNVPQPVSTTALTVDDDVYLVRHRGVTLEPVTSFRLTSDLTGEIPFTIGLGFKKGDVLGPPTLDLSDYQVEVKKRWNDNSVKHAIASGIYSSVAGQPLTVQVFNSGDVPVGTSLTESDIVAASPSAYVRLGTYGIVNLKDLLGTPERIWLNGPQMVEAHYHADVGNDDTLSVWFHVRLYAGGKIRIRAIVENGILTDNIGETKVYTPTVTIGGAIVYNNGGSTLNHYRHTRWSAEGWIGITDPVLTVAHDTKYLKETGLVPNYWKDGPSEKKLDGLYQTYVQMFDGDWTERMGNAGFQNQIGLLPLWDALYINSGGDSRAYKSVIANTESLNSYPIIWSDPSKNTPIVISDWPTWSVNGKGGNGAFNFKAGSYIWELNHHGSGGYFAYLITGDYYFLETMEYQSTLLYLANTSKRGDGIDRHLRAETRGCAWIIRTLSQLSGIGPDYDAIVENMMGVLSSTMNYWDNVRTTEGMNELGYFYFFGSGGWSGSISTWQEHFWMQSMGYGSDLEPLADMTTYNNVRDHLYKAVVGLLGANGTDNYCFTGAGIYDVEIDVSESPVNDPTLWTDSWGVVHQQSWGSANTNCGNELRSEGSPNGSRVKKANKSYWGNMLPALSYAVEDGATGASDSWKRFVGASNFSSLENSGFEDVPIWGIVPRMMDYN